MNTVLTPPTDDNGNEPASSIKATCPNCHFFKLWVKPSGGMRGEPSYWPKITKDLSIYRDEKYILNCPSMANINGKLDYHAMAHQEDIEVAGICDITFEDFYVDIIDEINENIIKLKEWDYRDSH